MTNEELKKIMERHAAAMRNDDAFAMDEFLDQVQHDTPALVTEVERLNERIFTLQEIITGRNSNLNPNLEQENPYSNEAPENGITNAINELVVLYDRLTHDMSCGDANCVINPPKGMRTNGGCRCELPRTKTRMLLCAVKKLKEQQILRQPAKEE